MKLHLNPFLPVAGLFLGVLIAVHGQQPSSSGTILRSAPGTPLPNKTTVPSAAAQAGSASGTSAGPSLGAIERSRAPGGVLPGNGAVGPGVVTALPTPSATPPMNQRSTRDRDQRNQNNGGGYFDSGVPTVVTPSTTGTTRTNSTLGTTDRTTATTSDGSAVNAGVPVNPGTAPSNATGATTRTSNSGASRTSGTRGGTTSGGTTSGGTSTRR